MSLAKKIPVKRGYNESRYYAWHILLIWTTDGKEWERAGKYSCDNKLRPKS